jgi:hypothetical protein
MDGSHKLIETALRRACEPLVNASPKARPWVNALRAAQGRVDRAERSEAEGRAIYGGHSHF